MCRGSGVASRCTTRRFSATCVEFLAPKCSSARTTLDMWTCVGCVSDNRRATRVDVPSTSRMRAFASSMKFDGLLTPMRQRLCARYRFPLLERRLLRSHHGLSDPAADDVLEGTINPSVTESRPYPPSIGMLS